MFLLKKILTALILPPTGPLLLAGLGLIAMRYRPRAGRMLVGSCVAVLLAMSTPWVANRALRSLEIYPPLAIDHLAEAQAIVILGGGSYYRAPEYGGDTVSARSLERCRYGARLARDSGLPILATGGVVFGGRPEAELMARVLTDEFGTPVAMVEARARDTRENALLSAQMLKRAGYSRIVLVSHAFHLARAVPLFEAQGLIVIPAPTVFTTDGVSSWEALLPSAGALRNMSVFCHEWLGRLVA